MTTVPLIRVGDAWTIIRALNVTIAIDIWIMHLRERHHPDWPGWDWAGCGNCLVHWMPVVIIVVIAGISTIGPRRRCLGLDWRPEGSCRGRPQCHRCRHPHYIHHPERSARWFFLGRD